MMKTTVTTSVGGRQITIETGRLAKQADGSVLVTSGANMVLVTAVSAKEPKDIDFFPLTVEYQEKFYATGKIPGGYFKREGRPNTEQILIARLIDRPIRPKFPEGYRCETQVVATVLSADGSFPVDILSSLGASAALHISDIPFDGPTASVQVARVDGQLIANPTPQQVEKSDMDLVIAGTRQGLLMVEGETKFISEADAMAALKFGHQSLMPLLNAQDELREKTGSKQKRAFTPPQVDADFRTQTEGFLKPLIEKALNTKDKGERYGLVAQAKDQAKEKFLKPLTDKDVLAIRKKDKWKLTQL